MHSYWIPACAGMTSKVAAYARMTSEGAAGPATEEKSKESRKKNRLALFFRARVSYSRRLACRRTSVRTTLQRNEAQEVLRVRWPGWPIRKRGLGRRSM